MVVLTQARGPDDQLDRDDLRFHRFPGSRAQHLVHESPRPGKAVLANRRERWCGVCCEGYVVEAGNSHIRGDFSAALGESTHRTHRPWRKRLRLGKSTGRETQVLRSFGVFNAPEAFLETDAQMRELASLLPPQLQCVLRGGERLDISAKGGMCVAQPDQLQQPRDNRALQVALDFLAIVVVTVDVAADA